MPPDSPERPPRPVTPGPASAPATPRPARPGSVSVPPKPGAAAGTAPADSSEDQKVGGGPHAQAANAAMLALARAARSFTLYDPANKVVRSLIGEYREKMRRVLEDHGALAVSVHPFELLLGKDVIYRERDRERSLAFRLFRDGVRQVSFSPTVSWEELLRLLEIFSVRYTAVRQQEDDLVTLLRKAAFEGITVVALEGFVPDEELAESVPAELRAGPSRRIDPPRQWDLPLPPFPEVGTLQLRKVGEELQRPLREEESPAAVPASAVQAVRELLAAALPADLDSVLGFAVEVRDFLVVEGRADCLAELVGLVRAALAATPQKQASVLSDFLGPTTIRALVLGLPADTDAIPPELAQILDLVHGDILEVLLDLMGEERDGPRAALLQRLVARAAIGAPEQLLSRAREADPEIATALLGVLHELDPGKAVRAELELAPRAEPPLQLAILGRLEAVRFDVEVARTLKELTTAAAEEVRVRALEILAAKGGARSFATLQAHAERRHSEWSAAEAAALGRAMVKASPPQAFEIFNAWLHPKGGGLLGRLVGLTTPHPLQQAALAGLSQIGGPDAQALLERLAKLGAEDLRKAAESALTSRKQRGGQARG